MPLYEHVFLARQDVTSQQVEEMTAQYKQLLESQGGSVGKIEHWGVKPLAYRINKNRKAHYTLLNIDAPSPAVAEMERQMGLSEDVLRFMTIKVEEFEDGPSAMLQRRDRDDRDDRPRGGRGGFGGGDRGPRRDRDDRDDRPRGGFGGDRGGRGGRDGERGGGGGFRRDREDRPRRDDNAGQEAN